MKNRKKKTKDLLKYQSNSSFKLQLELRASAINVNLNPQILLFICMEVLTWCTQGGLKELELQNNRAIFSTLAFGMMKWLSTTEGRITPFRLFKREFSKFWLVNTLMRLLLVPHTLSQMTLLKRLTYIE